MKKKYIYLIIILGKISWKSSIIFIITASFIFLIFNLYFSCYFLKTEWRAVFFCDCEIRTWILLFINIIGILITLGNLLTLFVNSPSPSHLKGINSLKELKDQYFIKICPDVQFRIFSKVLAFKHYSIYIFRFWFFH